MDITTDKKPGNNRKGPQTIMVEPDLGAVIASLGEVNGWPTRAATVRAIIERWAQAEGIDLVGVTRERGFRDEYRPIIECRGWPFAPRVQRPHLGSGGS